MTTPAQVLAGIGTKPATRRTALVAWCVFVAGSLVLTVVAVTLGPGIWPRVDGFTRVAVARVIFGMALFCLLLSKVLPSRIRPAPGATPESYAVGWSGVASSLNGSLALLSPLAWMVSGKIVALIGLAISLVGLVLAFPSERRWRKLRLAFVAAGGQESVAGPSLATPQPPSRKVLGILLFAVWGGGAVAVLILMGNMFWTEEVLRRPFNPIARAAIFLIMALMLIGFAVVRFMAASASDRPHRQRIHGVLDLAVGVAVLLFAGYLLMKG